MFIRKRSWVPSASAAPAEVPAAAATAAATVIEREKHTIFGWCVFYTCNGENCKKKRVKKQKKNDGKCGKLI